MSLERDSRIQHAQRAIAEVRRTAHPVLDLSWLDLSALPGSVVELSQIQGLVLSGNQFTALPEWLAQLTQLRDLDLSHNQLRALPESLGQLTQLRSLDLSANQLKLLPESLGQLTRLQDLVLSANQLRVLPESLGQLRQLQSLFVSDNQLLELPESLGQLTQLQILNVSGNQLTALPESLRDWISRSELKRLDLRGNNALGLPPEILVVGLPAWEQVRSLHRRQLRDQDSKNPKEVLRFYFGNRDKTPAGGPRPLNEAKVLVLGEAEVGKTSLIAALTERRLRQSFDKTHGIVRQRWVVPGPGASPADVPAPRRAPSGGLFWGRLTKWLRGQSLLQLDAPHFRLNVWDFGGQEIYHATHMFFLTQRAVYVVVADARQNDRQNNLDYWLQMARSFGGGAPIWVAVNKCDQPGDGPDEQALLRKFAPELRGFVRTSCWSGEGLEELARKLVDEIAAMEEVRRLMNPAWLQIKQELEQMPGDTLSLEEYGDLCQRCGEADPADQQMLLGLWHRLGTVLYFHEEDDPPEMKELGILNPEWVTRGVYAVLDSPELRERGGLLTEDLLAEVLHRAGYKGGQPRFIEQMMRKFDLLYDAPDQRPRAVLVPQLLADKEPALNWPVSGTLRFCYEYEVLPAGLLPRFIVRLHRHLASKPGPWRKGCVLNLSGCQVLVRGDLERKQVEVSVREGPPAMRREALDRVRFTFDSIHAEIKDLPVKELIPVPGRPDAPCIDYRHLRTWEWNGRAVFDAMGSQPGEIIPVNVREALEGVRSPLRAELERAEHFKKQRLRERVAIYTDKIQMESLMKEDRRVQVGGSVGGGARLGTGEQTSQGDRLKITARDAGELLQLVAELRQLIAQARAAGAEADNCDVAEEATVKIQTALQSPSQPAARKEAKGALAMLKGTAEGFGTLADIGEKFARILKFVEPGIEKLFEVMT